MSRIFGEFIEEFPIDIDSLEMTFTSSSKPLSGRWRNHRLSAYFIADYFANIMPIDEENYQGTERLQAMKNAVSYIGNELLENAMKFHEFTYHEPIKLGILFLERRQQINAVIVTKNSLNPQRVEPFQAWINELLSADLNELYVQQIEKTAEDKESEASGLGLLTMLNDYSAKLGWKFESDPSHPLTIAVTTMAQIIV